MGINLLEQQLSAYFERDYVTLTRSGSFAIVTALHGAGIELGSDVIIPASCCPIVLFAVQMAGFNVVLADVSLLSLSMEVEHIDAVMNQDVKAIVAVHGYGHYCEIDKIANYAKCHALLLIEDACLAYGGQYKGKPIGSFGDFSVVSFGYDKPIAANYGGALMTNNEQFSAKSQAFLSNNQLAQFTAIEKLKSISSSMTQLDILTKARQKNIAFIEQNVTNLAFKKLPYSDDINYWRYPLFVEQRNMFLHKAKENNIVFTTHYKSLGELQTQGHFVNATKISNQIINLFVQPFTKQEQLTDMVEFINDYR
ncbi:DegT/DnrJ/EryC1/StrS family aminotransferase [Pseudoalteromonas ostreae]|uniref:DegT/DnrJ/EryC1/StrS family aminotransferase n=1 Tax=Pseudoalteromonas ostreae TaxID=2774154 RepID=UPI001B3789DE|nr:DegT/DnrJ/EryC1/StrS family aminotransferase [Pseudoalteromonas ostreae]